MTIYRARKASVRYSLVVMLGIAATLSLVGLRTASADHGILSVDTTPTAEDLVALLVAGQVDVVAGSAVYTGHPNASGTFSHGDGIIGFESGVVLSTGLAAHVIGPNQIRNSQPTGVQAKGSTNLGRPGDAELTTLIGNTTNDAAILEFEFNAPVHAESLSFRYVFGSEEYNEWVTSQFNDVFAFWVNGENCALVEGSPVSVNSINNGSNSALFIDNTANPAPLNTELDGLTVVLTCNAPVIPGEVNTVKLAIADTSDSIVDSAVFIEAGSFTFTEIGVDIDIKPGSDPNSINLGNKGTIPVAILSTETFDATAVDQASLTFGESGDEESLHYRGRNPVPNCGVEDVNGDGLDDLVCHFHTQLTGLTADSTEATLKGTIEGVPFIGTDSVNVVP